MVHIPAALKRSLFSSIIPVNSGSYPACYLAGTVGFCLGSGADQSPRSSAKVKDWDYTCIPPISDHVTHRDSMKLHLIS
jgi:hypothetical protein